MRHLTTDVLRELLKADEPPCISLYQPTHRANPDALQDPIRYKNLVRDAERSLREKYSGREVRPLLERFQTLADDYHFWAHQRDGLAVLGSAGTFEVFRFQRPVKELVVVADSFHLKPLLRVVQSADRYQVLCLDRHEAKLFEGNRDALDEVDVGDMPTTIKAALGEQLTDSHQGVGVYGKRAGTGALAQGGTGSFPGFGGKNDEMDIDQDRFFQVIDREVLDRFSRPSGSPLPSSPTSGRARRPSGGRGEARPPTVHAPGGLTPPLSPTFPLSKSSMIFLPFMTTPGFRPAMKRHDRLACDRRAGGHRRHALAVTPSTSHQRREDLQGQLAALDPVLEHADVGCFDEGHLHLEPAPADVLEVEALGRSVPAARLPPALQDEHQQ